MSLFRWSPEYSIDHASIDAQHKSLFQLAEDLHHAMVTGAGEAVTGGILHRLIEYTKRHFSDEESIMLASGYPLYAQHKAEHDELTRQVLEFQHGFEIGYMTIRIDTMRFLRDWLATHIKGSDAQIGQYIRRQEMARASAAPIPSECATTCSSCEQPDCSVQRLHAGAPER